MTERTRRIELGEETPDGHEGLCADQIEEAHLQAHPRYAAMIELFDGVGEAVEVL